jgi:hypothetical protein
VRRSSAVLRSNITVSWSPSCSRISIRSTPRSPTSTSGSSRCSRHTLVELLCTIPGVQTHAAQVLIAECGLDMTQFPTVAHFASRAGACPGHHQSAGRRRSGQTRPGPRWLTDHADRVRQGRRPHQEHLPRRSLRPATRAPRRAQGDRRATTRHPRRLVPHRPRPGRVPRTRPRPAPQTLLARTPRPPTPTPTRSTRLHRHPASDHRGGLRGLNRPTARAGPPPSHSPAQTTPAQTRPPTRGFTGQPHSDAEHGLACQKPRAGRRAPVSRQ